MKRKKRILKKLSNYFKLWRIEVYDISYQHKGHNHFTGNDETHISIKLHPKKDYNYSKIEIHRKINDILKDEFSSGLHALEIKIKN